MSRCSAPVACAPLLGVLIVSGLLTAPIIIGRAVSSSVWRNVRPWLSECHATTDSLGNTNAVRILCPPQLQEYAVAAALVVACYVSLAVGFGFAVKSCVAAPGSAKYTKIKNPLSLNNNTASKPISSLSLNREDDQDDNLEIGVKAPILVNRSFLGSGVDDDDLENDLSEIGESRVGGPSEDIRVHGGHVSVSIASVALFRYAVPVCLALLLPASSRTAVVVSCGLAASAVLDVTVQLVVTLVAGKQNSKEDQLGVRRRLLALSFHGLIEGLVSVMDIYLLVELFAKPSSRLIAPSFFTLPLRWCWLMATSALVATQVLGAAAQLRSACGLGAGSSAAIATFGGTWLWHGVPDVKLPGSRAFVLFEFLFRHVALAATRYAWLLAYVGYQLNINEKPFSGTWHPTLLLLCITTAGGLASLIGTVYAWLTIGERMTTPQDSPEQRGWISRYTFWWVFPTLRNAFNRGRVEISDLPSLPHADTPKALFEKFRALWAREETPNLMRLLVYGLQPRLFLFSFLNGWAFLIAMFLDPLILNALLTQSGHQGTSLLLRSLGLVVLLSASMLVRVSCMEVCFFTSTRVMNNSRSALVHAVFRKSLYIAQRDAAQTAGALTNMMATDADAYGKMSGVVFFLAQWTFAMVSLPGVLFFLHRTVGNAAFVGTAAIIVGQFLNLVIMWISKAAVRRVQKKRDERSEAMLELIRNMKMVKLMAWESLWRTKIVAKREEEMEQIVKQRYLRALSGVLSSLILLAIPVSIFGYATMVDKRELDAAIVFTTLAWIAQMQWSINTLPTIFGLYAVMSPSTKRLSDFLGSGDMGWVQDNEQTLSTLPAQLDDAPASPSLKGRASPSFKPTSSPSASPSLRPSPILGPILVRTPVPSPMKTKKSVRANAVRISDATISYGDDVVLKGVNLALEVGELVVVTGEVGSGKSTLLATIANALPVSSGSCQQAGARAYVSQKPFLLNASIRDNVLFGLPMNQADYEKALELSALEPDLHAFQHGDGELVGESGVQLSGGQRSRVALARALYAKADLLVLDDVLSAVDAHTGSYIWEKAITPLVANKTTVVLATHQLQYLARSEVSRVVVLKDRKVFADGPWDQVKTQVGPEFLRFVDENKEDEKKESAKRKNTNERLKDANLNKKEQAGDEETRKTGTIEWKDFRAYLKVFGSWWTVGFLIIFAIAATALTVMSTVWLSIWSDHPGGNVHGLTIYAILGGANALMTGCQTVMLTLCALAAGRALHRMMLQRVLRSKMTLFDTTPAGRIMNRFLQDMASIDQFVPDALLDVTTYTLTMLSQIGLIFAFAPFVALCIPIIGPAYFQIYKRVRIAARDTRRIESVAHSPVYSHFGDTLIGRPVIAAFGAERRFLAHNLALVAEMARAKYSNEATCKWAQALTTQTGSLLYFACGLVAVVLHSKGVVSKAQLGLVMLYAAQLQRSMMEYLMRVTDMETNLVSVERVVQYANLPCEPNFIGASEDDDAATPVSRDKETVPDGWPNGGDIVMKSVDFRYKPELPLVLKNFHLHIPAGSKVAVCGRTGCGKSSMFGVLCRLYSTSNGTVLVDGVDVGQVSLARLRRNVRVVPQDALLSAATVRENLIGNNPDTPNHLVEAALSKVGMLERLLPKGGIQAPVTEAGANFSVGERQLLTLARALLPAQSESKPPRVLLCDEATANVDLESDELVHNALLSLANTTVVMICHRLQHIERFDLVMVLDGGQVGEMGPPKQLLKDENSRLSQLVSDAGL